MDKEIALKILRELHDEALFSERTALETFIPELKESEDEKIRKAILAFVRQSSEVLDKQNQNNMIDWLEKQGEKKGLDYPYVTGWRKNYKDNKPKVKHSVLMFTTHGIAEGEWLGEEWCQYRWSCKIKDEDVLYWLHLSDLENLEKENVEQKPAWSEEDETTFKVMLEELEKYVMFKQYSTPLSVYDLQWFKSLKDRVQPQPKQEWSEEDENTINALINLVKMYHGDCIDMPEKNRLLNWLVALTGRIK